MTERPRSNASTASTQAPASGASSHRDGTRDPGRAQLDHASALSPAALCAFAADPAAPLEVLVQLAVDRARLAAVPELAAAVYGNRSIPLSVANRVVATCAAIGVVPEGIPGFPELAAAIAADPAALDGAAIDGGFDALLGDSAIDVSAVDASDDQSAAAESPVATATPSHPLAPGPSAAPPAQTRRSAVIDFSRLKLYEKIRLATLGNAYCRQNLLRDANRMVALAVIRSPQITDGEIVKAAGNRTLNDEVIRYIANRKELVKLYAVKLALVGNPKCPLAIALRLLPMLNADDIKQLARSKNVPGALSVAAKRLAAAKGPQ